MEKNSPQETNACDCMLRPIFDLFSTNILGMVRNFLNVKLKNTKQPLTGQIQIQSKISQFSPPPVLTPFTTEDTEKAGSTTIFHTILYHEEKEEFLFFNSHNHSINFFSHLSVRIHVVKKIGLYKYITHFPILFLGIRL